MEPEAREVFGKSCVVFDRPALTDPGGRGTGFEELGAENRNPGGAPSGRQPFEETYSKFVLLLC